MYRGFSDIATARVRRRLTNDGKRVGVMCSLTAIMLVRCIITSGLAIAYTPELRAPIYEPRCLGWAVTTPESFPPANVVHRCSAAAHTLHLSLHLTSSGTAWPC